jgi:hypothetical protein
LPSAVEASQGKRGGESTVAEYFHGVFHGFSGDEHGIVS